MVITSNLSAESEQIMTKSQAVSVDRHALVTAWALLYTREWPFSMMQDLAQVKIAFEEALKEPAGE
jgi:hypothetical protein